MVFLKEFFEKKMIFEKIHMRQKSQNITKNFPGAKELNATGLFEIYMHACLLEYSLLHTGLVYLIFYPGSGNLILPMLSYPVCHVSAVHWLYWNSRTWSSSDVIGMLIKVTSSDHVALWYL